MSRPIFLIRPLSHRVCVCVCMYYVDPDETARARGEATRWEREVGRGVWRGGGVRGGCEVAFVTCNPDGGYP